MPEGFALSLRSFWGRITISAFCHVRSALYSFRTILWVEVISLSYRPVGTRASRGPIATWLGPLRNAGPMLETSARVDSRDYGTKAMYEDTPAGLESPASTTDGGVSCEDETPAQTTDYDCDDDAEILQASSRHVVGQRSTQRQPVYRPHEWWRARRRALCNRWHTTNHSPVATACTATLRTHIDALTHQRSKRSWRPHSSPGQPCHSHHCRSARRVVASASRNASNSITASSQSRNSSTHPHDRKSTFRLFDRTKVTPANEEIEKTFRLFARYRRRESGRKREDVSSVPQRNGSAVPETSNQQLDASTATAGPVH